MAYIANPVAFDGANDYAVLTGAMTGAVDSKLMTGGAWIRRTRTGVFERLFKSNQQGIGIYFFTDDKMWISSSLSGSTTLTLEIATPAVADTDWHWYGWSVDLANIANRHVCVDTTVSLEHSIYNNNTMDFTPDTAFAIGANTNGDEKFAGDLADVQIWFGVYLDLSVLANRELFILNGAPVDPATAEATLGAPIWRHTGATGSWHTNSGTGGGFTLTGALTDGAVPLPGIHEALAPDAILASTNLTGAVTAIDDDPDSPGGDWLTATSATAATDVRVSFPTPG